MDVAALAVYLEQSIDLPMLCTSWEEAVKWRDDKAPKATIKIYEPGYDVGFKFTDFTYPDLLVCNAGDTVTSVLDKIIGILGNYLYLYDVEDNYRFQEKQNYLNMTNTSY